MKLIQNFYGIILIYAFKLNGNLASQCTTHESCYKIFSLNTYCCKDECCDWFTMVYKLATHDLPNMQFKPPTALTIALIAIFTFILSFFLCCFCILICFCKNCCMFSKKKQLNPNQNRISNKRTNINSTRHVNRNQNHHVANTNFYNQSSFLYQTNETNTQVPTNRVFTNLQQQQQALIQPSAPLLNSSDNLADQLEFDCDRPPAYDELLKLGELKH